MSRDPNVRWLLAASLASAIGQWLGASLAMPKLSVVAAALLPIASLIVGITINGLQSRQSSDRFDHAATTAAQNAKLLAIAWSTGATAMLAVYLFSGLRWQHGWQYGTGMALIAALVWAYVRQLTDGSNSWASKSWLDRAAILSAVQGVAAVAGLMILFGSGKAWSHRTDWAANIIFVSGGVTLAVLSAFAVRAHLRLR